MAGPHGRPQVRLVSDGTLPGTRLSDGDGAPLPFPVNAVRYEMSKGHSGRLWLAVPAGNFEVDIRGWVERLVVADEAELVLEALLEEPQTRWEPR